MEAGFQLLFMALFGGICAAIASSKGRSAVGWFFLGFFFGCIALIIISCLSNLKDEEAKWRKNENEQRRLREQLRQEKMKSAGFKREVNARLDVHDAELNMDTRGLSGSPVEAPPPLPFVDAAPPKKDEIQWYYAAGGRQQGPVGLEELRRLNRLGEIGDATLVWNSKLPDWKPIREIPWLQEKLK